MKPRKLDWPLLALGLAMIGVTIALAYVSPEVYKSIAMPMRILAALGGAFVGGTLPGLISIDVKGIRAAGALALVVLFFLYTPNAGGGAEPIAAPGTAGPPAKVETAAKGGSSDKVAAQPNPNAGTPATSGTTYNKSPHYEGNNGVQNTEYH